MNTTVSYFTCLPPGLLPTNYSPHCLQNALEKCWSNYAILLPNSPLLLGQDICGIQCSPPSGPWLSAAAPSLPTSPDISTHLQLAWPHIQAKVHISQPAHLHSPSHSELLVVLQVHYCFHLIPRLWSLVLPPKVTFPLSFLPTPSHLCLSGYLVLILPGLILVRNHLQEASPKHPHPCLG